MNGLSVPNLTYLDVSRCENLNSLPEPINIFTSLKGLTIQNLPNLESFANEGLPVNLQSFTVCSRGSSWTRAITEWSLQRLTYLTTFRIGGDDLLNALMKMKVPLLPNSLVSLYIYNLPDVKSLDGKWLQHLTSLENIEISCCRKLESLPEEGLPSSLSVLTIKKCPLLEASCNQNGGKEWPKIAHIPCLIINKQVII
jgi:Leucine-rich repeat (LRR) protein